MHALAWIACALGCVVLWVLQELVGGIVGELLGAALAWIFAPLHRTVVVPAHRILLRCLSGPSGRAWLAALTAAFVAITVGAGALVAMAAPPPWLAVGACGTVAGLGALLVLDGARNEVERRRVFARAGPCPSSGARAR
jgi:hypothetical protein